jgi:hypothetical protein
MGYPIGPRWGTRTDQLIVEQPLLTFSSPHPSLSVSFPFIVRVERNESRCGEMPGNVLDNRVNTNFASA